MQESGLKRKRVLKKSEAPNRLIKKAQKVDDSEESQDSFIEGGTKENDYEEDMMNNENLDRAREVFGEDIFKTDDKPLLDAKGSIFKTDA
mmetsp:Transcript_20631/g.45505  ORF Transcript_20631/g.45505 Transcript_20631/m.45505 type:complete len:90 (+) Transcript_20631:116-385(+)